MKSGSHSPNYKRMAMYGAAGVAGLGALYGAKKLFWDEKPPPPPSVDETARMQNAQESLKEIMTVFKEVKQEDAGYDEIKEQVALLAAAIERVGSKELTVKQAIEARAAVDAAARTARDVLKRKADELASSSTTVQGYSNLSKIVAGLGALVAVGAVTYTGFYGLAPTLAIIQTAGGYILNSGLFAVSLAADLAKYAYSFMPSLPSLPSFTGGKTARRRRVKNRSNTRIATPSNRRRLVAARRG